MDAIIQQDPILHLSSEMPQNATERRGEEALQGVGTLNYLFSPVCSELSLGMCISTGDGKTASNMPMSKDSNRSQQTSTATVSGKSRLEPRNHWQGGKEQIRSLKFTSVTAASTVQFSLLSLEHGLSLY